MNWEVAKNWLIAAFLLLDLILGWQIIQSHRETYGYVESYSDLLANTKTVLADHGFILATKVPENQPEIPTFRAEEARPQLEQMWSGIFPGARILKIRHRSVVTSAGSVTLLRTGYWRVEYEPPLVGIKPADVLKTALHGNLYAPDPAPESAAVVTYVEEYQGYPIFDAAITIHRNKKAILSYDQNEIVHITPQGRAKPVISAMDALNSLAESVDNAPIGVDNKILSIQLGYAEKTGVGTLSSSLGRERFWFPVWRVTTEQQVYVINALTGEVDLSS
ncbi:MAG: two-component system regulatory protein YycI [Alicyclobacillaceae bacterium]|jgi:regulatory protein YycI of two-component signal transduction system YycFG|nr:two-component system regulatory protein YycI [Alicyclobacillaceae bacterium]MCY0895586.1 two-component system regulatory protein YycI [Alicyclobacillaceae bacterium]